MPTVELESTMTHPDATLAVHLCGDVDDPIPPRPGFLATHLGLSSPQSGVPHRAPLSDLVQPEAKARAEVRPGPLTGLQAQIRAISARIEALDDDLGACLETHGHKFDQHGDALVNLQHAVQSLLVERSEREEARQTAAAEPNLLAYARRAIECALADLKNGEAGGAVEMLELALTETETAA